MSCNKDCSVSVSESLRCPICTEFPDAVVYQCINGHSICNRCSVKVTRCPECRVLYGDGLVRNRVMEDLLEAVEMDCPNKNSRDGTGTTGCDEKVKLKDVREHSRTCNILCKKNQFQLCKHLGYPNCGFPIDMDISSDQNSHIVRDHFITRHHAAVKIGADALVNFQNFRHRVSTTEAGTVIGTKWSPIILSLDGTSDGPTFLICMMLHSDDPRNLCWFNIFLGGGHGVTEGQNSSDGARLILNSNYDLVVTVPSKLLPLSWENIQWRFPTINLSKFSLRTTLENILKTRPFRTPLNLLLDSMERDDKFLQLKLDILPSCGSTWTGNSTSISGAGEPIQEIMCSFDMDIDITQTLGLTPSGRSSSSSSVTEPIPVRRIVEGGDEDEVLERHTASPGSWNSEPDSMPESAEDPSDDDSNFICCICSVLMQEYPRYCCMQCANFFICNGCYNNQVTLGEHKDHVFVLIEREIQMDMAHHAFIPGQEQPQLSVLPDFCKGPNYLPRCHHASHESPSSAPTATYVCVECSNKPWSFCSHCRTQMTQLSRANRIHHANHFFAVLDTNERSEVFKYFIFKGLLPKNVGYWNYALNNERFFSVSN